MGTVTRTNGLNCTAATLYNLNANAFLITVKNAGASAIDLRAEDDAVDEAVEQIVKEINPLMFFVTNSSAGTIHVIMDSSTSSAAELQVRIRRIGIDGGGATTTSIGPNDVDISGTTVAAGASITVA
jgi:hypothetical protein